MSSLPFSARSGGRRKVAALTKCRRFESLEPRQMMAANALLDLSAGPTYASGPATTFTTSPLTGTFSGTTAGMVDDGHAPTSIPVVQELNLNSKPGAPATLFLDFNGHFQRERVGLNSALDALAFWGDYGWENIRSPAYDTDGDPTRFSVSEQNDIRRIWALVAEDYAPFNINVTTVDPDPGGYHPNRPYMRVIIHGGSDFRTSDPGKAAGGFADYDAYADGGAPNVAYVFAKDGAGQAQKPNWIGEAASHETAHAFGLRHYAKTTSNQRQAIMETDGAFGASRGTWHTGVIGYRIVNGRSVPIIQDDMAVIAGSKNGFGYRPDDHGDTFAAATPLSLNSMVGLHGKGIIEKTSDVDMFRFETGGGEVSITLNLPLEANLDATLKLYHANGTLLAADDDPRTVFAYLHRTLAAGTYYLAVGSHGAYGDVGGYSVHVQETVGPRIVGSQFSTLSPTLSGLLVTFNEPINPLTFTTMDVRINGAALGVGVVDVQRWNNDPRQFLVKYLPAGSVATPKISIGPNIADYFGNLMDQNQDGFKGQSNDYYTASFASGGMMSLGSESSTSTKKTLAPRSVDAFFAKY